MFFSTPVRPIGSESVSRHSQSLRHAIQIKKSPHDSFCWGLCLIVRAFCLKAPGLTGSIFSAICYSFISSYLKKYAKRIEGER